MRRYRNQAELEDHLNNFHNIIIVDILKDISKFESISSH